MVYVPDRKQKEGTAWFLVPGYGFYRAVRASRYKVLRYDAVMVPGYRTDKRHWRSFAVHTFSEAEIYHGAGFCLRAAVGVRVPPALQRCLGSRNKSKNRDKQLTHIVRFSKCLLIKSSRNPPYHGFYLR
jgi:hypothetical protein